MTEIERIDQLREELHRHNYNYYVLNAPEITDQEFDKLMRELQDLEGKHPEHQDENSPTMRVGSDINKNFTQVVHKYPMLSLAFAPDTLVGRTVLGRRSVFFRINPLARWRISGVER